MSFRTVNTLSRSLRAAGAVKRASPIIATTSRSLVSFAPLRSPSSSRPNMAAATLLSHTHAPSPISPLFKETRDAWAADPIISYDEVKKLTQQPTDNILLIDVREPDEVALGNIPSSVNLPLSRIDDVLTMGYNPGAFQQEFAFAKPLPGQNIVFYCRSGKRSAVANEVANRHGYLNTRNFVGSWLEWCEQEGIDNNED